MILTVNDNFHTSYNNFSRPLFTGFAPGRQEKNAPGVKTGPLPRVLVVAHPLAEPILLIYRGNASKPRLALSRRNTLKLNPPRRRWFLGIVLGLLFLAILGVVGFDSFRAFQVRRLTARARDYLGMGDLRSASLTAKSILQINLHNADGLRILAQIAEQNGEPSALEWRQRVVTEAPDSVPDVVALAKTAIRSGELGIAEDNLNRIANRAAQTALYHAALAALQLARKNQTAAEQEYEEAIRLDPPNDDYHLALAVLQLGASSNEKKSAARQILHGLMAKRPVRLAAGRALLEEAVERKDPELITLAKTIFDWPEATVQDRIRYVEISAKLGLDGFPGALTQVQDEAALDPSKLTELLSWMSANHEAVLGIEWAKRLPAAALEQRPVFVALADCFAAASDCAGLRLWTRKFAWKDLDFLRHAYLAYAHRSCGDTREADLEWTRALQAANNVDAVMTLQRAAAKWGWKDESVDLLWQLAKDRGQQKGALATLNEYYTTNADTNNLYKVSSRLLQISPNDPMIKNNFAQLSLLLGINTEAAEAMAKQLHQQSPKDPNFASTYAFALYVRGDSRGALKVMNSLSAEDLRRPEIAAYYGVILAAGSDRSKAPSFLELGREAKLLPEEKALVEKATGAFSNAH